MLQTVQRLRLFVQENSRSCERVDTIVKRVCSM